MTTWKTSNPTAECYAYVLVEHGDTVTEVEGFFSGKKWFLDNFGKVLAWREKTAVPYQTIHTVCSSDAAALYSAFSASVLGVFASRAEAEEFKLREQPSMCVVAYPAVVLDPERAVLTTVPFELQKKL